MLHAMAAAAKETRRRRRARLRRRRRPLRRGRQRGRRDFRRQDRRHAGARPGQTASEPDLRRRRQIDRPVRHRSGAEAARRQGRLLEDRPFPHQAARARPAALAGFEKSGHFFFNAPIGRGYDDGFVTAIAVLDMLDRNPGKSMADLYRDLPKTWGSPTMSPHCADEVEIRRRRARRRALRGDAGAAARRSPGRRSATSSRSTARA